jgi:putative peptidoglycan lipid II flippase
VATGVSRVAGLVREIIAANYFGVSGAMSAFTIAFQVPNLMRALFADAALQGAFVPIFTELLEKGRRREALNVAWSVFSLISAFLGAVTLLFFLLAGPIMKAVTPGFDNSPELQHMTIVMARVMFPVVLLLALSGVIVGMLNSLGHFSVPALTPVIWNLIIIGSLVFLRDAFSPIHEIYAYAVGVLLGTIAQFLIPIPVLFRAGIKFQFKRDWHNEQVWRVLRLMLPVTIALGLINFDALINSIFGTLVSDGAPAAIDKAFRIYQLPQGLFSVAIATILFPTLSRLAARGDISSLRHTMANGVRQVLLLLIPSAVLMAVLAEPITRLVYQRGAFGGGATHLVSEALLCWSFSLPFQGASLMYSRTFFSIQKPWLNTALALANLSVNALFSAAFYYPWGITGVVLGSVAGTFVMAVSQAQGPARRRGLRDAPHGRAHRRRHDHDGGVELLRVVAVRRGSRPLADRAGDQHRPRGGRRDPRLRASCDRDARGGGPPDPAPAAQPGPAGGLISSASPAHAGRSRRPGGWPRARSARRASARR